MQTPSHSNIAAAAAATYPGRRVATTVRRVGRHPVTLGAARGVLTGVHVSLRAISTAVIGASLAVLVWFVVDDARVEQIMLGQLPNLFYGKSAAEQLEDHAAVLGVAHNSGDSVGSTRLALRYDADVIEIDLIEVDRELYAAHLLPPQSEAGDALRRLVAGYTFRGPRLSTIWAASDDADVIALDLKQSSRPFLKRVVTFLRKHREHQVIVSSHSPTALRYLEAETPTAFRFLGIGSQRELDRLMADPELAWSIDGVGIRHDLLDDETAEWLNSHDLLILAWTVNNVERAAELVDLGVDGITTDNLAILEILGAGQQAEQPLLRLPVDD